jgi:hypothetical protein
MDVGYHSSGRMINAACFNCINGIVASKCWPQYSTKLGTPTINASIIEKIPQSCSFSTAV